MELIEADNAAEYLRRTERIGSDEKVTVTELSGGVSNRVLYVRRPAGTDFVLKQARERLRTEQPWFCGLDRIWREVDVLQICRSVLDPGQAPDVLFRDEPRYLFAMTAAPWGTKSWKQMLLAGKIDPTRADQCGQMLGRIHAGTWHDGKIERRLSDRKIFKELRLDPYYRSVALARPEVALHFERLISSIDADCHCLVHADFAPKNLLVAGDDLMLVDYETGHFGDPAFDLGFLLSHLALKSFELITLRHECLELTRRFWAAYQRELDSKIDKQEWSSLVSRGIQHFAGCAWARIDGTSKIDYLHDPMRRQQVRTLCQRVLEERPEKWQTVLEWCGA